MVRNTRRYGQQPLQLLLVRPRFQQLLGRRERRVSRRLSIMVHDWFIAFQRELRR